MVLFLTAFGVAAEEHVTLYYLDGKVEVLLSGRDNWEKAEEGMRLYTGDSIKTGRGSCAELAFGRGRGNVVRVNAGTFVVVKIEKREKIELIDGEVFMTINRLEPGSVFEVKTPSAVCGARGTDFSAKAGKKETVVASYKDRPYAKGIKKSGKAMDREVLIKEGYKTMIRKFREPAKLRKLAKREIRRWEGWKADLAGRGAAQNITGKKPDAAPKPAEKAIKQESKKKDMSGRMVKMTEKVTHRQDNLMSRRDSDRRDRRAEAAAEAKAERKEAACSAGNGGRVITKQ